MALIKCSECGHEVSDEALSCPNCGHPLKFRSENTSILKQILVYFVSFFLAPFGLGYAFKYLKQSDKKSKIIGIISLILTFFAIITVIVIAKKYLEQEYGFLNLINNGGL